MIIEYFKGLYDKIINPKTERPSIGKANIYADEMDVLVGNHWESYIKDKIYLEDTDTTRYEEFDTMEAEIPELSMAIDAHADYIVYPSGTTTSDFIKVTTTKKSIQKKIDVINKRVDLQTLLYPMIRGMIKNGDNFEELVTNIEGNKFLGFRNIPIQTCKPIMKNGFPNDTIRLQQRIAGKVVAEFTDGEIFHLSLNTDRTKYCKEGKGISILEKARLTYRQLKLMEEGLIITRLSRSNQNYAIILDVGEAQGDEVLGFIDDYKKKITRRKYIDPRTGQWTWAQNPLSVIEDIIVPTRSGSGGNVIALNSASGVGHDIKDILYFQDKLIYSTGTPKILVGKETDTNSKSTSDNQMIGFVRRIKRFQNLITPDIKRLYTKILAIEGVFVEPEEIQIEWTPMTTVDEERKVAMDKLRAEVAKIYAVDIQCVDDKFIHEHFLGLSAEESDKMIEQLPAKEPKASSNNEPKEPTKNEPTEPTKNEPKE